MNQYASPSPYPSPSSRPAIDPRAKLAAILCFVCAGLLLITLFSHGWFSARKFEIGLLGIEQCRGGGCRSASWFDAKMSSDIQIFSVVGLLGGLAGIGFLIQCGVVLLLGKPHKILFKPMNSALGLAAFGIVSFAFRFIVGEYSRGTSIGWATVIALIAVIGAAVLMQAVIGPIKKAAMAAGAMPPPGPAPAPAPVAPPPGY